MLKDDFKSLLYKIDIITIGRSKILKLIDAIRASNPDSKFIYKNGCCYQFALILRSQFKGEIWYAPVPGHVYFKYEDKFYDIDGICHTPPKDIHLLNHRDGHRPHRWKPKVSLRAITKSLVKYVDTDNVLKYKGDQELTIKNVIENQNEGYFVYPLDVMTGMLYNDMIEFKKQLSKYQCSGKPDNRYAKHKFYQLTQDYEYKTR